ncbi:MAG: thio(seleno)oxazole modification radical SAM maturase SbtM [Desulfobulbaceae bacterium]|nr:thio(seleno)oxazole modification radical SAM maturase SbtM [Desulfobulbaceae bacterium]
MDSNFSGCRAVLSPKAKSLFDSLLTHPDHNKRFDRLQVHAAKGQLPAFFPDLFRLEEAVGKVRKEVYTFPAVVKMMTINPSLNLIAVEWSGLDRLLTDSHAACSPEANTFIMIWRHPQNLHFQIQQATEAHLLALKMIAEGLNPEMIAQNEEVDIGLMDAALRQAVSDGIILSPPSAICRPQPITQHSDIAQEHLRAEVFTLQWHVTQACDLHCKHCYDRSRRDTMPLDRAITLLDEFRDFCRHRFVQGQVTFTGGNPLLYPHFAELYRATVARHIGVAILGNPAPRLQIEELISIAPPLFYQVSLEGLAAHNDYIRGTGHFARVIDFLALLKELGVYSMVMLTLTRENQSQVLPLAEILRDKVDLFTFNRLAMVGEGAKLQGPEIADYQQFLASYRSAAKNNPCMGLKDNLFNLQASGTTEPLFGGCAGHGCGAAFNFVSILADGEVHACRKFPSPIGNVFTTPFATIYDSQRATAYRQGSAACSDCHLRPLCGGCLAVTHGMGLDPLLARDPYCWQKITESSK